MEAYSESTEQGRRRGTEDGNDTGHQPPSSSAEQGGLGLTKSGGVLTTLRYRITAHFGSPNEHTDEQGPAAQVGEPATCSSLCDLFLTLRSLGRP